MPPKEAPSSAGSEGAGPSNIPKPPPPPNEPPRETPPVSPPSDADDGNEAQLELRLARLRDRLRLDRGAIRVTNPGLETGRPALNLSDDMKPDPTNPYNRPSIDALSRIRVKSISNNMATSEDMMKIFVALEGLGVPTEQVQNVIMQVVIYCKDASSSIYLDPRGTFEWPGGAITADSVVAAIKTNGGTLRRVCRLYAPLTWNYMLIHDAPPSDWAAMGFAYNERFAAFDCLDYVENTAAVGSIEGLIRRPTPKEKAAHETYKDIALRRNAQNDRFANLGVEVTGGKHGPEVTRDHTKSNNQA